MAKMYGLGGVLSGKLGNTVLAVRSGVQIARQYQPVVNNPKSEGQKMQRAKGNLVGQLSKLVPYQVLLGLGNSRSGRRSRFLRIALQRTTAGYAAGSTSEIVAKLLATDVVFSEGALVPAIYGTSPVAVAQSVNVEVSRVPGATDADFNSQGILIIAVLHTQTNLYQGVLYDFIPSSEIGSSSIIVSLPHSGLGAYSADVYEVRYSTMDGSSLRTVAERILGVTDGWEAILKNNPSALPLRWGNSVYIGTVSFTPSTQMKKLK